MKIRNMLMVFFLLVALVFLLGAAAPEAYFQMDDPVGDEHGYGTYVYPSNIAFKPYQGLFDITRFKVSPGGNGIIYFDTSFAKVTNPWVAPEGFIHQNLRIFIDNRPNFGLSVLPEPGAKVRFNPKYAWDVCLKIVGWGYSQIITVEANGSLTMRTLKAELLNDHHTIRAYVPETLIGKPAKNWHYYVLVGSYDGFGEDFFRKVAAKPGEWVIGGGQGQNIEPRIMDILAFKDGSHSQVKQLGSFDPKTGLLAELYPVGRDLQNDNPWFWLIICLIGLLISGVTYIITKKPTRFSWFWVKQS